MVSETKLDDTIHSSLYELQGFHAPYLNNRNRDGGGTAIYTRSNLAVRRLKNLEIEGEDWIWAKVSTHNMSIIICSIYLPPGQTVDRLEDFNSKFIESIALANSLSPTGIFVLGDFNTGNIYLEDRYNKQTSGPGSSGITSFDTRFKHTLDTLDLTQLITTPTRVTETVANLRDLAITNNTDIITESGTLSSFGNMDHLPIYVTTHLPSSPATTVTKTIWDYNRLDADKLTRLIQTADWENILDEDIDTATEKFTSVILEAAHESIPRRTITIKSNNKPWVTGTLKREISKPDRYFKKAKQTDSTHDWEKWRQQRFAFLKYRSRLLISRFRVPVTHGLLLDLIVMVLLGIDSWAASRMTEVNFSVAVSMSSSSMFSQSAVCMSLVSLSASSFSERHRYT